MFTFFSFFITSLQSICERYFDIKLVRLLDMDIMDLFKTVSILSQKFGQYVNVEFIFRHVCVTRQTKLQTLSILKK